MNKLTVKNVQIKQVMADNQAKNEKYHQVIESAMSMTRAPTEETDDMTFDTQRWLAYTASYEKDMATMQKQLEECMRTNSNTCHLLSSIQQVRTRITSNIEVPLSDGSEGVTKTMKYYKNCDNACWSCGCDVSKKHDSGNCMKKKAGHVDWHTGDNPAPGASIKDKEFSKWR